ncbi:hypothetical protein KC799_21215, partial [candidate division KSB1 bacterium]|nr:hypothetical protein [candidate division KSB1 bacterium]
LPKCLQVYSATGKFRNEVRRAFLLTAPKSFSSVKPFHQLKADTISNNQHPIPISKFENYSLRVVRCDALSSDMPASLLCYR